MKTLFPKCAICRCWFSRTLWEKSRKEKGIKKGLHLRNPNVIYRVLSDFSSISIHNFRSFSSLCSCFGIILSQFGSIVVSLEVSFNFRASSESVLIVRFTSFKTSYNEYWLSRIFSKLSTISDDLFMIRFCLSSVSFSFSQYYGGVIKQYRFL